MFRQPIVNQWALTYGLGGPCDPGNPCAGARAGRADGREDGAIEARVLTARRSGLAEVVDRKIKTGSERERLGLGRVWVRLVFAGPTAPRPPACPTAARADRSLPDFRNLSKKRRRRTPSVDDLLGNVPGTTDCWASAGCSGYDPGSGTYTYESHE
jgi:hypothetical protein